jgi:hypothetical protein
MTIGTHVLASSLQNEISRSKENISIVCVSRDNKCFSINLVSSKVEREDGHMPNSIILTEQPLENFRIISRIASDEVFSRDLFNNKACRVIANSIEDKLKSFTIIRELRNCL